MNIYYFTVYIGCEECSGEMVVAANSLDEAKEKAITEFGERWINAFPSLDVTYDIEEKRVKIDINNIINQVQRAKRICPGNEEVEITYDSDDDGFYIRRYNQKRGSAELMDGFEKPIYYGYDTDLDDTFDEDKIIQMVDYYTGR